MRIVVTGGTGFIGRRLVGELARRGDEVTVLTRDVARGRTGMDVRAHLRPWEPARAETWADAVRECEAVIHLAGEGVFDKRWTAARKELMRASRVDTTARLAEVIGGAANGPKVFVSASAIGVYGARDDDSFSPEGDRTGGDFLADLSVDWEKAAEAAQAPGVRIVHPRIGIVLGADGGALGKMLAPFKMGVGGPLGNGRQWFSWIHERDAVRAILFGLDQEITGAYNLVAPNPVTMNEFARVLGDVLGRPAVARVPAFALKLAMGGERAEMLLHGVRVVPKVLGDRGFSWEFPTLTAALADLLAERAA